MEMLGFVGFVFFFSMAAADLRSTHLILSRWFLCCLGTLRIYLLLVISGGQIPDCRCWCPWLCLSGNCLMHRCITAGTGYQLKTEAQHTYCCNSACKFSALLQENKYLRNPISENTCLNQVFHHELLVNSKTPLSWEAWFMSRSLKFPWLGKGLQNCSLRLSVVVLTNYKICSWPEVLM